MSKKCPIFTAYKLTSLLGHTVPRILFCWNVQLCLTQTVGYSSDWPVGWLVRQRAHSNPIADHCFDYPVSPSQVPPSYIYQCFGSILFYNFVFFYTGQIRFIFDWWYQENNAFSYPATLSRYKEYYILKLFISDMYSVHTLLEKS